MFSKYNRQYFVEKAVTFFKCLDVIATRVLVNSEESQALILEF